MADSYAYLKIADFAHWGVYLHKDQTLPGRCVVWYKNDSPLDILDISTEELGEYWQIMKKTREALRESFAPAMFNYATLQNATRHIHTHLIPRYSEPVGFAGAHFEDKNFGKNYSHNRQVFYDAEVVQRIREKIKSNLR